MKTTGIDEIMKLYHAARTNGMSAAHLVTLVHLRKGTCIVRTLQQVANVSPAQMSRILQRLEDKGLIIRSINDKDKRAFNIVLTAKGEEFLKEVFK